MSTEPGAEGSPSSARNRLLSVACAALPGAIGGLELVALLFFLNPHWPFEPRPLIAAAALYSVLLASVSTLVLLPLTHSRPRRARRLLPWTLALTFGAGALVYWINASYYSLYLPSGINQRLIRAALWLSVAAVLVFYTALLHAIHGRSYSRRTVLGLFTLSLLAVYAIGERRETFRPRVEVTPRPSAIGTIDRPNLLVVGLPTASLDVVLPLAERGQLPFLSEVLRSGAYGRLTTLEPTRSLPLSTSLVTGKLPFRHGVVDSQVFRAPFLPEGIELRITPVALGFSRWGFLGGALPDAPRSRSLALWSVLARLGVRTRIIGWHEAGGVPEDHSLARDEQDLHGQFWSDREAPGDPRLEPLAALDQRLVALVREDDERLAAALGAIAEAAAPAADPIAVFLRLDSLEAVSRETFGGYSRVRFDGRSTPAATARAEALEGLYAHLDAQLAVLWERLPEPRMMLIVSPYGIRAREGIDRLLGTITRTGRFAGLTDGAPDGLFLLRGIGVRAGFLDRVELTDVVPTLLYGLGFPSARDFDGRVLTEPFAEELLARRALTFVPSYETSRSAVPLIESELPAEPEPQP